MPKKPLPRKAWLKARVAEIGLPASFPPADMNYCKLQGGYMTRTNLGTEMMFALQGVLALNMGPDGSSVEVELDPNFEYLATPEAALAYSQEFLDKLTDPQFRADSLNAEIRKNRDKGMHVTLI